MTIVIVNLIYTTGMTLLECNMWFRKF